MFQKGAKWRFETFQPCPPCLKTFALGTLLGHLSGGPREVNERTSPKHTSQGAHGHPGDPKADFGVPRGVPFGGKILQNTILEDMPLGVPRWSPDGPQRTLCFRIGLKQDPKLAVFFAYCGHSLLCSASTRPHVCSQLGLLSSWASSGFELPGLQTWLHPYRNYGFLCGMLSWVYRGGCDGESHHIFLTLNILS